MQKCSYCGADFPENSRFCGNCGSVQDAMAKDAATTRSTTSQSWASEDGTMVATWPPDGNYPTQVSTSAGFPNRQAPETPPPLSEDEDERERDIPPLFDVALGGGALLGSEQIAAPGAPVVQGTPQIGSAPGVAGSPTPSTNAPASPPAQNAPTSPSAQAPANAPSTQAGQQAAHNPPGQPGTQEPHPPHGPHRHPTHPTHHKPHQPHPTHHKPHPRPEEHEPHQHHARTAQHQVRPAARVIKAGGGSSIKTIIIVVTAAAVVAAGGLAATLHFLSHPQPLISISSKYTVGNTPAGANGTILHISGQNFSSNSAITFLLDGAVAPGNPGTQSDSNGSFSADMTITSAWSAGTHTLAARDASNDSTKNSVSVTVVQPGQANIPGPNGAPPDDASFKLNVTIQVADPYVGEPFASNPVLLITGHPDPDGGTVCSPEDSGQSFSYSANTYNNGTPFTSAETATCSGTYKAGQISYTETDTSVQISYQFNGGTANCTLNNPAVILQLTGAYAGNNTFSGTINYPYVALTCDQPGSGFYQEALQGTWTGTIVTQ